MFDDDFEDEYEGFNPYRAQKELITLPELSKTQNFLCDQCGSGNSIKPLRYRNVDQRIENMQTGECTENSVMIFVSPCCKSDISIWDESIEDYVAIDPKYYSNGE